ncbi:MAG: MFS transporter [Pirellulales bacterium]
MTEQSDNRVRYWMVLLATMVAVLLYLDRVCISTAAKSVEIDLHMESEHLKWVLSAFFWTYALAQLPAGWIGDRFGARWVLGTYVALWSLTTALLAIAWDARSLLVLRLLCGLFEAGAYPVAAGIVRKWVPAGSRGLASGFVSVGGRLGGALAPIITIELMYRWSHGTSGFSVAEGVNPDPSSWRPVMALYGIVGVVISAIFVWLYRDKPEEHPLVTERELAIIQDRVANGPAVVNGGLDDGRTKTARNAGLQSQAAPPLLWALMSNPSLCLMSFVQFASNLSWAFLVTMMPVYLEKVYAVKQQSTGWMQSLSLGCGIFGLLLGGTLTDWATRMWGLRFGRAVMLMVSRGFVGTAFIVGMGVRDPLQAAICLAVVGFATDLGIGSMWTYAQDVGGKHAGTVLGWSNMWGNLGAALSPILFGSIAESQKENPAFGWQLAFLTCACVQFAACAAAYGVSAARPLFPEQSAAKQ